jgi:hypothetical protein
MSSGKEKEFDSYARDCVQLADQADTPELREAMINMAREWMQAVMDEEDGSGGASAGTVTTPGHQRPESQGSPDSSASGP